MFAGSELIIGRRDRAAQSLNRCITICYLHRMSNRILHERNGTPLIMLATARTRIDDDAIEQCSAELLARSGGTTRDGFAAGYLLGVEFDSEPERFPASAALLDRLKREVIAPLERHYDVSFGFSFIKLAEGEPPHDAEGVYYEGVHLDSHPGVGEGRELLRVLVNLADAPRMFVAAETDWMELRDSGVEVGRTEFRHLTLPPGIAERSFEIPARMGETINMLHFWASVVPHVGINRAPGYFLASFEGLADFTRVRIGEGMVDREMIA